MSFEYIDLVRDAADRTVDAYKDYRDNLEPGEDVDSPDEFVNNGVLHDSIEDVLIPSRAVWTVIMEYCSNEYEVLSGDAPDYDGESAYARFYDDCMNEFMEQMK